MLRIFRASRYFSKRFWPIQEVVQIVIYVLKEALTAFNVPLLVPIGKPTFDELLPMELRGDASTASEGVGLRENMFTFLKILSAHIRNVIRMPMTLALASVPISMPCANAEAAPSFSNKGSDLRAIVSGRAKAASNVVANDMRAWNVSDEKIDEGKGIFSSFRKNVR